LLDLFLAVAFLVGVCFAGGASGAGFMLLATVTLKRVRFAKSMGTSFCTCLLWLLPVHYI